MTLTLPAGVAGRLVGLRRRAEPAAVLHHPARAIGLVGLVGAAVHVVLFLQAALPLAQPGRARLRNRPGLGGAPLVEAALGIAQPAAPALRRRQLRGQLIAAPLAEPLVLGAVDRVRLGQDLRGDLVVVEVLVLRRVRVHLRAIDREHRDADQAGVRAERQHVAEQASQRRLVALAKARDRAVIGPLVRGDHPERDIVDAGPLDHPRRTPPDARTRRATAPPSSPDRAPPAHARPRDKRHRTPPGPSPRPPPITNHAKWSSGSHSRRLGGINNTCSRSHAMKFCAMPESSRTSRTAGPLCNSHRPERQLSRAARALLLRCKAGALLMRTGRCRSATCRVAFARDESSRPQSGHADDDGPGFLTRVHVPVRVDDRFQRWLLHKPLARPLDRF